MHDEMWIIRLKTSTSMVVWFYRIISITTTGLLARNVSNGDVREVNHWMTGELAADPPRAGRPPTTYPQDPVSSRS